VKSRSNVLASVKAKARRGRHADRLWNSRRAYASTLAFHTEETHHDSFPSFPCVSGLSRRDWLKWGATGMVSFSQSGWLGALAANAARDPQRKRSCILLWMSGGPSQLDTFDLKPGHPNGGPFKPIQTSVPGIQISEHFSRIARLADHLAIVRSMTSKEGDHGRATYLLRTGYVPQGPVEYPVLGSLVSKELGDDHAELPNFVSIAPYRFANPKAFGAGFLGPRYAPLIVGEGGQFQVREARGNVDEVLKVQDLALSPTFGQGAPTPACTCFGRFSGSSWPDIRMTRP